MRLLLSSGIVCYILQTRRLLDYSTTRLGVSRQGLFSFNFQLKQPGSSTAVFPNSNHRLPHHRVRKSRNMAHRLQLRSDDFDVIGAVPRDLSVIKNFLKRDCAVKRLIDIEEEFLQQCVERGEDPTVPKKRGSGNEGGKRGSGNKGGKRGSKQGSDEPEPKPDPCKSQTPQDDKAPDYCDACRRLKTSVGLEELTMPAITNPSFNKASPLYFDEETVMGNSMPKKFRFRRKFNPCDQEKSNHLMATDSPNTNVVVLTNCCDVMAWPSQRVAQMNRVPVTMLTGEADLTEYMLEEETIM